VSELLNCPLCSGAAQKVEGCLDLLDLLRCPMKNQRSRLLRAGVRYDKTVRRRKGSLMAPVYKHKTRESADNEAARLARNNPGQSFYTLMPIRETSKRELAITEFTDEPIF